MAPTTLSTVLSISSPTKRKKGIFSQGIFRYFFVLVVVLLFSSSFWLPKIVASEGPNTNTKTHTNTNKYTNNKTENNMHKPNTENKNHLSKKGFLENRFFAMRHGQSLANVQKRIASDPESATTNFGLSKLGKSQANHAGKKLVEAFCKEHSRNHTTSTSATPPAGILVLTSDLKRAKETAETLVKAIVEHNEDILLCRQRDLRPGTGTDDNNNRDDEDYDPNQETIIPLYGANLAQQRLFIQTYDDDPQPTIEPRLRERWFGSWDGRSDRHYQDVWDQDKVNPRHTLEGVESVWSVFDRATQTICDYENLVLLRLYNNNNNHETNSCDKPHCVWIVCVAHGDVLQILQTAFAGIDPRHHRSLEHLDTAVLRPLRFGVE